MHEPVSAISEAPEGPATSRSTDPLGAFVLHVPSPPLSGFVDYLWLQEGPLPSHALERVVPTGTIEIVIALATPPLRVASEGGALVRVGSAMVCGAQSTPFVVDTRVQTRLIGVHFKPGGAFPFFAVPAAELRDRHVGLGEVWGRSAEDLQERLMTARTAAACFAVLERALVARIVRPQARHPAVVHALGVLAGAPGVATIAAIREPTGLSPRRFIEIFDREVGLTPKLFARISRLQEILRRLEDGACVDWVGAALAAGYFDQAHLIRDFREFTGLPPTAYLARRGPTLNHIVLPEPG